ncbi:MAG TPA: hypothetical protein DDW52_13430 [Planctomycetaceae bacterium]|nr:hypothetical protein [Planctomycetaceae bacterium]
MTNEILGIAKPIVETASNLLERLAGKPCEIAGEIVADQLYAWQCARRISIFNKASENLKRERIDPRTIAPGFLMPLLEAAGNIDDEELQKLWANLLVSAVESDSAQVSNYIETLRGITRVEAQLLTSIAMGEITKGYKLTLLREGDWSLKNPFEKGLTELGFPNPTAFWAAASRLYTCGLLVLKPSPSKSIRANTRKGELGFETNEVVAKATSVKFLLTPYGFNFLSKVTRKSLNVSVAEPWEGLQELQDTTRDIGNHIVNDVSRDEVMQIVRDNIGVI